MGKITSYTALTAPAGGDQLAVVDVSDTTMASSGTTKRIAYSDLTAGFLQTADQPYQFRPETYGAKGDGRVLGDVVTNSTTTITSASAGFTAGDAGKHIMIHGANGPTSGPLITTISSVTNPATAVLAGAAGASVSNCPAVYGTDDTAAINSALSAGASYATTIGAAAGSGGYQFEVLLKNIYVVSAAPTQTSTPVVQNSQVVIPHPAAGGTTAQLKVLLTGPGDNGSCQFFESLVPNVTLGSVVSMQTAPSTPDATFGNQSVIGGPSGAAGLTGGYSNVKVVVKGVAVWCPQFTNMYAYDFGYCAAMRVQQSAAHIFAPTGFNGSAVQPYLSGISATAFLNSIGAGFRTPTTTNNDDVVMDDVTAEGYECAFRVFDHFTAGRLAAIYSDVVMLFSGVQGGSATSHAISVQQMSAEAYNGGLLSNGGTCQVDILWDAECTTVSYDVNDSGHFHGIFRFRDPPNARTPTVLNGAANLKIINDELGPGAWAGQPAVPASTTAQQNTSWRDAAVSVKGGTVTVVAVDGVTCATATNTTVIVPGGKNITLTYSVAPTWAWTLL